MIDRNQSILKEIIVSIEKSDEKSKDMARERLDSLAKPLKSLGKLEDIAVKLAGITGNIHNTIQKKRVIIMCSDNGVVEEGVASGPQSLTKDQTINFTKGLTGVCAIAKAYKTNILPVDVGVNYDFDCEGIVKRKIRKSTYNIAKQAAMTYDEAIKAILIGIEMVKRSKEEEYDILGVGEMGIGNTTTSSACAAALLKLDIECLVGKGAGLTDEAFLKKKNVVKNALKVNDPNINDPIDVVAKVGGFDIAAMAGVFIGSAFYKIPVVIDGFISAVAALIAVKINNNIRDYLITSHCSQEIGYIKIMEELELEPMLNLDMRLGEGSGCPIAFSIVEAACSVINNMVTFKDGGIDNSYLDDIREEKNYKVL